MSATDNIPCESIFMSTINEIRQENENKVRGYKLREREHIATALAKEKRQHPPYKTIRFYLRPIDAKGLQDPKRWVTDLLYCGQTTFDSLPVALLHSVGDYTVVLAHDADQNLLEHIDQVMVFRSWTNLNRIFCLAKDENKLVVMEFCEALEAHSSTFVETFLSKLTKQAPLHDTSFKEYLQANKATRRRNNALQDIERHLTQPAPLPKKPKEHTVDWITINQEMLEFLVNAELKNFLHLNKNEIEDLREVVLKSSRFKLRSLLAKNEEIPSLKFMEIIRRQTTLNILA